MNEDKLLDGKKLANKLNSDMEEEVSELISKNGVVPTLATVLVGDDPASEVYIRIKHRVCEKIGINSISVKLDETISKEDLTIQIEKLNKDSTIHGILLQLPLPKSLQQYEDELIQRINPLKDVDGFNYINRGKLFDYNEELAPCTPKGIIKLLEHYNVEIQGKDITIINRSNLVGKPLMFMFLKRNGTISVCHTSTRDIDRYIKQADILVVAVGRPKFITEERIKKGVIIIDVGTNRVDGNLCGDVDFEGVLEKVSKITPSPGGVGPMTVSSLMRNTIIAYKRQLKIK
ncbi:MAG: Bifunctional protein FolD [Promethearchaeota archaeon]|nr:MAG: Bifunctional protein FolD [Candidatus Lokiarchaeota archaeon]